MPRPARIGKRHGFALVVTLSLMMLLTVIAIGLLGLSQISLRTGGADNKRREAQQNARLGMMMALAELQRTLGPDSRASLRSDLLADNPASPRVLGVVKTVPKSNSASGPAAYLKNLRTDAVNEIDWLVSSQRSLDPLTQAAQAASDQTAEVQGYYTNSGTRSRILAGKIPVKSGSSGSNQRSGAYAWWVDDESQKASIHIAAPEQLDAGTAFKDPWKMTPSQQSPLHRVDSDPNAANYAAASVIGYNPNDSVTIGKLLNPTQADIKFTVSGQKNWFQSNQLDFTCFAKGLPVDVTTGRLKQDLGYYFETGNGLGNDEAVIRGGAADSSYKGPKFAGLDYNANDMPRFGRMQSWKQIGAAVTGFDGGGVKSRPKTRSDSGVSPVIARAGIYYAPYFDPTVTTQSMALTPGGAPTPVHALNIRLAAYPRVTLWNPTSVPITDASYLFQVGITNHFMLYAKQPGSQAGSANTGAGIDNNNVLWWRSFDPADTRKMMFYNMMNSLAGLDKIDRAMPFMTFALKLDSPLLPGQTRTFYPLSSGTPINPFTPAKFQALRSTNLGTANLMGNTPAANNYFQLTEINGTPWVGKVFAKAASGNMPMLAKPAVPQSLDTYLFMRQAESGANFSGTWTHGCGYRLWKVDASAPPELLQEFFSAEHAAGTDGTLGFPSYSISNAQLYDDPDDGVDAPGQSLVKAYSNPNQEISSRRGHQIYLSFALEDPKTDFNSVFQDGTKQFASLLHYNPRSRYIFPGTFEEQKTGTGGSAFDPAIQGVRQELYSEGRPEAAWINDWPVDSYQSSEDGYGSSGDYGTASLYDLNLNSNGLAYPFYDFPRSDDGVLSLGDLSAVDFATYPWQPGHAFGNSFADPRVPRSEFAVGIPQAQDHFHIKSLNLGTNRYIDLSWLLNHSLWDRFFISTIPYSATGFTASTGKILRNARHEIVALRDKTVVAKGTAFDQAAAQIQVKGVFNVNSTSVAAWKNFLGSNMNLAVNVESGGGKSSPPDQAGFARNLYPYRAEPAAGDRDIGSLEGGRAAFGANRSLTDEELQLLAEKTVEEVKKRGPFLSIADFVNRRLVAPGDTSHGEWAGLSGTLQTAIDRVTVEDQKINFYLHEEPDLKFSKNSVPTYLQQDHVVGMPGGREQSRLAGAPGSLTQADVLRSLGPLLTVRGDTFRIRSYGEARNPTTGAVEARAWCEAVVQRGAQPLDPADDVVAPNETVHPFGRAFEIVGFRWLHSDEI